ncbi:hypothetical protein SAMN05192545_2871 [Maribacter dokdonensis]|uniref:Uncharacterized protein n=1 Tax=Maribacter dokdonensis TaxID=320912 RepID=A0ABY0UTC0_9FLAO|nr:hypothetical protein [Maribacter dokdonensis]SDT14631.1 hypothetical protein SAMN05192545_2871 [Maribacter dokdonensis]
MDLLKKCLLDWNNRYGSVTTIKNIDNDTSLQFTFLDMQKFALEYQAKSLQCPLSKSFSQLRAIETTIQTDIEKRRETYRTRTEHWQDSQKGLDYLEKTGALVSVAFAIEEAVAEFETYNDL